jgi:ankyrin repeat protein
MDKEEKVNILESKADYLYKSILDYNKKGNRPIDRKRINDQIGYGFFYTDKTYGLFKDTILIAALNAGLEEESLKLAKHGSKANIKHINDEGDYALLIACKKKYKDVVFELLKHKGNPCSPNEEGETPLMIAVSEVDMIDVVKAIIKYNECDVNYTNKKGNNAITRILEVGNFEAFKNLLHLPEIELDSYDYGLRSDEKIKLTLLEYVYVTNFGSDYSENHKYARKLLDITGMGCNPLHVNTKNKITALMFATGDTGNNVEDSIYNINKILHFAELEKNTKYPDFKNTDGLAAFDLLFRNAIEDGTKIDIRIIKLFLDYYYKNNKFSKVFLRNIPIICNNHELFEALKSLYPESKREILDNACKDIVEARAVLINPVIKTPSPEIQVAKRAKYSGKDSPKEIAEEIPIVHAESPVSPFPLWAQVGDPLEPGVRQPKRYSPTRGGKPKNKKTRKNK